MYAKQSTAKTFLVGPILDSDGVAKTDEVVGSIKVTKNGTVGAVDAQDTLTHNHTGHYVFVSDGGDFDTVGEVEFSLNNGTNAMAPVKFQVLPANVYDSIVGGTDTLQVETTSIAANAINAAAIADSAITRNKIASGAITTSAFEAGAINTAAIADGTLTANKFAALALNGKGDWLTSDSAFVVFDSINGNLALILEDTGTTLPAAIDAVPTAQEVWEYNNRTLTSGNVQDITQAVWQYGTRILTADTNINYPSAATIASTTSGVLATDHGTGSWTTANTSLLATSVQAVAISGNLTTLQNSIPTSGQIADAVWDELIAQHNVAGTFGAKNQLGVPSETLNDYKATGFSTHSAADVWSVTNRILTNATNLSGIIAQAVWEYTSRLLTGNTNLGIPGTGDISKSVWEYGDRELTSAGAGGATAQEVWEYNNRYLTSATNISGVIAQHTWEYPTRILTAGTNLGIPTSGDNAGAVWQYGTRILTANTNLNDPTAATISAQVASDLLSAHGAGAWTTANVSSLATTSQLMSVSGDLTNKLDIVDSVVDYSSGVLNTVNQNVSHILIYNNVSGVPLTVAERNSIADAILQRSMSFVEDSSTEYTLCTLVLAGLNSNVAGTTRFIKKTDGTSYTTQNVDVDAAAVPITGVS